jgi:hypothetical protein
MTKKPSPLRGENHSLPLSPPGRGRDEGEPTPHRAPSSPPSPQWGEGEKSAPLNPLAHSRLCTASLAFLHSPLASRRARAHGDSHIRDERRESFCAGSPDPKR